MFRNKLTFTFLLFALLCGFSGHAHAQGANPQQIAIVSWVGTELNKMVSNHIDVFLAEGQSVLDSIFALLLVWYFMAGLFSQQLRNELLVELVLNFMICQMMLTFYDSPMPWGGGASFHQIFSQEAQWAAATLDIAVVNNVISGITAIWQGLELPHAFDILGYITYGVVLLNLSMIWLFCSGITLIAHIALGFGALMGPLVIPFFIWPVMSWLFWGWVKFMTTYALYIVSSSAVVFIYANVMLYFFTNLIGGNYSLGNFSALILPFTVLNLVFLIAFWQCHTWAREMASGSANMGSAVSGVVQAAAMAIVA